MDIEFQFKTGGSAVEGCPARYKVTSAEGGYVVQGVKLSSEVKAHLREFADDEDAVWVPADIIERDKLDMTEEEFVSEVRNFRTRAFRLEAQPGYVLAYERPVFESWLAGVPVPPPEIDWWAPWLHRVAGWTAEGKTIGRVRVLAEPPTAYQRWLMWATPWHAEAGEELRYMFRGMAEQIGLPLADDFWLLDDERVIVLRFNGQGEAVSRTLVTDPEVVAGYCALRDVAIGNSALAETVVPA
jgi:hypothetical protein